MAVRVGRKYQHLVEDAGCACCDPRLRAFTDQVNAEFARRGLFAPAPATRPAPTAALFTNVRVFDSSAAKLSGPSNVLISGNRIEKISSQPIDAPDDGKLIKLAGDGATLIPGLIDAHTHIMFTIIPLQAVLTADIAFVTVAAVKAARDMLMRGFTSIRDMGGPVFGLKRGIDSGLAAGPRIWPSGAFISQTGGHGDFRMPNDLPARPGDFAYSERVGAAVIADDPDAVRKRAREQLALGASQIKLMAGGGVASHYDPLDVTQYTAPELRAAVEAAENWGTYAAVHAYTPRAVRQSLEAGVRCIEHGQLLDDATVALMAERDVWWCLQPFLDDADAVPFPEGSASYKKQQEMVAGTDNAYRLAKKHAVKTAFGTDTLFDPRLASRQGAQLAKLARWYAPAEILKMATADNAQLLALSGLRSPYEGKLGVVEEGALADLILVDGDPTENIGLIENPEKHFLTIVKDGVFYKNALA